jgi:H+/Cl- antiporter ClcA
VTRAIEALTDSVGERATYVRYFARWLLLVAPVALTIGSLVAFFLWALESATRTRLGSPWLLWLLPFAGVVVGLAYHRWGKSSEAGNNLIVDEIHEPGGGIPGRMTPLVLLGTIATHLFGGSAGREGTAVQMGGSIASTFERLVFGRIAASRFGSWFQLDADDQRQLLQAGIAAGFGAVFGTPITGAIFALEVLTIGRLTYLALVPCLLASIIADWATRAWGIHHTLYPQLTLSSLGVSHLDPMLLAKVALAAVAFGIVSTMFAEITHLLGRGFRALVTRSWLRPALGAVIVIAMAMVFGRDYLGLGVTPNAPGDVSIVTSFNGTYVPGWAWAAKLIFTAVTLASGFKGGEVTPLFFIGAALGHSLAVVMHAPIALFAALGFVAVFAGATNTPLACTIMGVELFGADAAIYIAAACFLAYLFSGHSGIYVAQRIATPKGDMAVGDSFPGRVRPIALRHLHAAHARYTARSDESRTPRAEPVHAAVPVLSH